MKISRPTCKNWLPDNFCAVEVGRRIGAEITTIGSLIEKSNIQ